MNNDDFDTKILPTVISSIVSLGIGAGMAIQIFAYSYDAFDRDPQATVYVDAGMSAISGLIVGLIVGMWGNRPKLKICLTTLCVPYFPFILMMGLGFALMASAIISGLLGRLLGTMAHNQILKIKSDVIRWAIIIPFAALVAGLGLFGCAIFLSFMGL